MANSGTNAVFFLGSRAHYQVLEPPNIYDAENGNTSTETIYQNPSVEELWPNEKTNKNGLDTNYNPDLKWSYNDQNNTEPCDNKAACVKRRVKRRPSEALLCDTSVKPAALNHVVCKEEQKEKPRRTSLFAFLTSLARRKRRLETDQVQYLQHIESVLNNCTYRESCRCLDCQSRYFECAEESDEYSSDDEYSPFSVHDESQMHDELDDEVFLESPAENDNTSTDLLLDEQEEDEEGDGDGEEGEEAAGEEDKQLQMEVAASTSAMFNILLYHPFSCTIQ